MSLHEITYTEKDILAKKRTSIHEIGQPPVPKPRSALQSSQSLIEPPVPEQPIHDETSKEGILVKEKTATELKIDKAIEADKIHAQEELTSIIEGIESVDKHHKIITEYQASFLPPSERKEKFRVSEKSQQSSESQLEKDDSIDSDKAQKGSSQLFEQTGYISDSEDVENVISDSEIEDRVPQIRERQMSVFAPPVTQRKTIYERSASLPTEDLYEVSRNLKQLKEKYEEQIKKDMIEEQFVNDSEEECSPERKTFTTLGEEKIRDVRSFVIQEMSTSVEEEQFEPSGKGSLSEIKMIFDQPHSKDDFKPIKQDDSLKKIQDDITRFIDKESGYRVNEDSLQEKIEKPDKVSVKHLTKTFERQISSGESDKSQKTEKLFKGTAREEQQFSDTVKNSITHKIEDHFTVSSTKFETHKETESVIQHKIFESQPSQSSDRSGDNEDLNYKDESCVSKDSMEVHVDKSEIEDSEKFTETDYESKSLDSLNVDQSPKQTNEDIPEITVTLSGKQRRISEESDEYSEKVEHPVAVSPIAEVSEQPNVASPIKQPEEHIQDILWEATVETQFEQKFEEKVDEIDQQKNTEEFIVTSKILKGEASLSEKCSKPIAKKRHDKMLSEEEDEYSQVDHIVKRQSVTDLEQFEQKYTNNNSQGRDSLADPDNYEHIVQDSIVTEKNVTKAEIPSIKENISEKLTKEIHDKLSEKLKTHDIMIEKAVSEEVDDTTLDELKELMVEEALEELHHQKPTEKDLTGKRDASIHDRDDDLSSGVKEESELGSEMHTDHSDSLTSDRIKSESHSEIEKIILDTFQHMKVDPEEAKKIASQLIEEIENEIQNRGELTRSEATQESLSFNPEMSVYLKKLAETNGLDEREVELVESVLARRQRELAKLARGDTQASSMEITDEDLRYSGGELADYTHTLEQQMGQLEAEKVHDLAIEYDLIDREKDYQEKSETYDKVDEKHITEKIFSEDSQTYDNSKIRMSKRDTTVSITDSVKGEKSYAEHKNVILEEDETISESSIEEHAKLHANVESTISEISLSMADGVETKEITGILVQLDSDHKSVSEATEKEINSKSLGQKQKTENVEEQEALKVSGKYSSDRRTEEVTDEFSKELKSVTKKAYDEAVKKDEKQYKEEISMVEKFDNGTEISTNIAVDKKSVTKSTEIVTKDQIREEVVLTSSKIIDESDLNKLLNDAVKPETEAITTKTETFHRTSSSDSKSSLESAKSPDKKVDTFGREQVIFRKSKSEVDSSSSSSNLKPDRRSGIEFEAYSSSGESHYQSFEDSGRSRPCSSDVEGIVAAASSDYDTALTSTQEYSAKSHVTSTDYHTAISSISSKESMKSLDSESSGNLASIEVSEHSETLVPSTSDLDGDILDSIDQQILEDGESSWTGQIRSGRQISDLTDSEVVCDSIDISEEEANEVGGKGIDMQSKMKRSAEMTFQPEPKVLTSESPQAEITEVEEKFGQSLDDGSILSMSVSSTSSTGAQRTVIEMSERHEGNMTISGVSEHLSLEDNEITMRGSQESLPLTPTIQKTYDMATSTSLVHSDLPIEHVTITTSSVREDGIHSASTQIISGISENGDGISAIGKFSLDEPKRKGHRRTESTMIGISLPSRADLSTKEVINDEKKEKEVDESEKDIDEKEQIHKEFKDDVFDNEESLDLSRPQSRFSKSDSDKERPTSTAFSDDRAESELGDLIKSSDATEGTDPIERPTSPELQDVTKNGSPEFSISTLGDIEQQFSPRTKEFAMELQRKRSTSSISDISKEILEKRDSHGKSSSTSSEKSSFEEAEAEAAFNMVAHISPAHKVKQILPILEDEDAEKHELELKEKARHELELKRALQKDISPGFIPDITVTDMTPDSDHDDSESNEQPEEEKIIKSEEETKKITYTEEHFEIVKQDIEYKPEEVSDNDIVDDILTSSMMTSTLIDSTTTESDLGTIVDAGKAADKDIDSQSSDSFEMLEKPDIMDDFVVIEEVGKEAQEFDTEGQSVQIDKKSKKVKKHDEEIEKYLAHSAPTPLTRTHDGSSSDELGFEFEDSPPRPEGDKRNVASTSDYGYEYDRELEANKQWIEQQFQGDQAAMIAAGYGYEMEFERGPLEDIKEEDINDFAASSYGSQKESGGSLGSVKDSYSSTPDYDVLAGRKYFTRTGEHDDLSVNSLQEFENLEQAMSLEMKRFHQGQGSDSSSSGSFKIKSNHGKNNTGDDISVSSLKEFEGLESACIQAHKIEVKAKEEEAMLAQIEEGQESIASESESCETVGTEKKITDTDEEEDYEKRMFEIDEIIKQAQNNVERFIDLREVEKTESLGRGDSIEEVSKVPELELDTPVVKSTIKVQWKESEDIMITSTDSLDLNKVEERRDSTDSLDAQPIAGDIMTTSTDSIELAAQKSKDNIMTDSIEIRDEKSYMVSSDSLELGQATSSGLNILPTDSIDEDGSRIGVYDHSSGSTGKDFSSSAREELQVEHDTTKEDKEDFMLHSIESLDPTSSAATHATMQYETDSVFSGSFTSGGSNTMVSSTDTIDPIHSQMIDVGAAARKVWFDEDFGGRRITEYVEESSRPYVSETVEQLDDEHFSHTIHRKVELAPEVRKVTFTGSDAEDQLKKFMQEFNEGEDVKETQEVDEHGNVHTKRVVQKRFIIKGDKGEQPLPEHDIEEYFRQMNQSGIVEDQGAITRITQETKTRTIKDPKGNVETTITKKFDVPMSEITSLTHFPTGDEQIQPSQQPGSSSAKASITHRRPFHYEISMEDQTEVNLREHDWRFNLPQHAEFEEVHDKAENEKSKKVSDQHQLSEEMKELLKEMEKETKQ